MSIQKTQPSFTGKIESLRRFDTKERIFKPITQDENKLLRPLINYLKHHCGGIHTIQIQDNPNAISLYSEYTPKVKVGDSDSFSRQYSKIGNKVNTEDVQNLLQYSRGTTTYFKDIKAQEKSLLPPKYKPQEIDKSNIFKRFFQFLTK